jgi:hypothetical protein
VWPPKAAQWAGVFFSHYDITNNKTSMMNNQHRNYKINWIK